MPFWRKSNENHLPWRFTHEAKFDRALDLLRGQLHDQPRTKSGSFWHKGRYPNQLWLDGLYMGEPFYALESTRAASLKMRNDVIKQFKNVSTFNFDPSTHLFYHALFRWQSDL